MTRLASGLLRQIPTENCLVRRNGETSVAKVIRVRAGARGPELGVRYPKAKVLNWIPLSECGTGFSERMDVVEASTAAGMQGHDETGVIIASRTIGKRDQHLVDFPSTGQRRWVPFERLRYFVSPRRRFEKAKLEGTESAERFRLRNLACALENWHQNTGSLSHLDIDPLPHQIHLVNHILKSGNINWLIADDVGLGKTVETGMLISALRARGGARRILLICPAGLVKQWKDEMHAKFSLSDFAAYGKDFAIDEPREWKRYDCVIASLDLAKGESHLEKLMQADPWDLVVFDEAHRLSRSQWGMKFETSDRFRLAERLRQRTSSMLFLSATPHQGRQDKFQALLELLRPELKNEIRSLSVNPGVLKQLVIRNNKADVTDAEGNFIFKGKRTHTIRTEFKATESAFDAALRKYLERGYGAAENQGSTKNRAIGFVMTVYRKLAASSIAAIETALARRVARLTDAGKPQDVLQADEDDPFQGEWEEFSASQAGRFFTNEVPLLKELLALAGDAKTADSKLAGFLDGLLGQVLDHDRSKKVLIFSEYRATQAYIADGLRRTFGIDSVVLIHGGMDVEERKNAIANFEGSAQFLVSTEAGGEGINLQKACHVMVNYDLPWNPMRLVQRVGRLYRYGQARQVIVFNVQSSDTLDGKIVETMYSRIQQVIADLGSLGGEFKPGLEDEILGQVVSLLDVEAILEDAHTDGVKRTQERVEEALRLALEAVEMERSLFEGVAHYDPKDAVGEFRLSKEHVSAFVHGTCTALELEHIGSSHGGAVFSLRLNDDVRTALNRRASVVRVTADRRFASDRSGIEMLDADSSLFKYLIRQAKSHRFAGMTATVIDIQACAVVSAVLRWQSTTGTRMREEYTAACIDVDGSVALNSEAWRQWLLRPATSGDRSFVPEEAGPLMIAALASFDRRLSSLATADLHPEDCSVISAGVVGTA